MLHGFSYDRLPNPRKASRADDGGLWQMLAAETIEAGVLLTRCAGRPLSLTQT